MKFTFKTLGGSSFILDAEVDEPISSIKQMIAREQQYQPSTLKLIFNGNVLDDSTTFSKERIEESHFIVVVGKKLSSVGSSQISKGTKGRGIESTATSSTPSDSTPSSVKQQQVPDKEIGTSTGSQSNVDTIANSLQSPTPPSAISTAETTKTTTSTTVATGGTSETSTSVKSTPAGTTTSTTTGKNHGQTRAFGSLISQEEYDKAIQSFLEMGFDKDNIERCMRAAYYNPNRAYEFLLTGIPRQSQQLQQPSLVRDEGDGEDEDSGSFAVEENTQQNQSQQQQQQQEPLVSDTRTTQVQGNPTLREMLASYPQFEQIRAAIQQNPQLMHPILARIAQEYPQLMQLIQQNPQEFVQIVNQPLSQQQQQPQQPQQPQQQTQQQPPVGTIFVNQQEKEAIDRLVGMGFDRMEAAQAYFAMDKNEEAAANFLLESLEEDNVMDQRNNNNNNNNNKNK